MLNSEEGQLGLASFIHVVCWKSGCFKKDSTCAEYVYSETCDFTCSFCSPGSCSDGQAALDLHLALHTHVLSLEGLLGDRLGLFLSLSTLSLISTFTLLSSVLELMRVCLSNFVFLIFICYFCNFTLANIRLLQMGDH